MEVRASDILATLLGGKPARVAIAQQFLCSEHFLLDGRAVSGLDLRGSPGG